MKASLQYQHSLLVNTARWVAEERPSGEPISITAAIDEYYFSGPEHIALETLVQADSFLYQLYGYDDAVAAVDPLAASFALELAAEQLVEPHSPRVFRDEKKINREVDSIIAFLDNKANNQRLEMLTDG